jgi:hypothetical protein
MRTAELGLVGVEGARGPVPERAKITNIVSAEYLQELLYRTEELTDDAFDDLIDDIGRRAARLVLRAKAVGGDVRACDLYLRLCKEAKAERDRKATPVQCSVGESFTPKPRDD